jgi:hypothetical protein
VAWWDRLGKSALDAVGSFLDRILPDRPEPPEPPQAPPEPPQPPPTPRRARRAQRRQQRRQRRGERLLGFTLEDLRRADAERRREERERARRARPKPPRRYPRLLSGTESAVSPENLRGIFPSEEIARAHFGDLLAAGVPLSLMALWQTARDRFEIYVKDRTP